MALDPHHLSDDAQEFLRDYVLATLTTLRADGSPHVVPVGFSYDMSTATAMIIAVDGSQKVVNADRNGRAVVSQVDGPRWLSFEGTVRVSRSPLGRLRSARGRVIEQTPVKTGLAFRTPIQWAAI